MNESASLTLAIIGAVITWTGSVIALVIWLTGKFSSMESVFYGEMDKHRREDDRQFSIHATKIQRLELKSFGFTHNPLDNGVDPK